jgi:gliding motility-associated-like protein
VVTATDKFNCQHLDTVTISSSTLFPAPTGLNITSMSGSAMTWSWNAVAGATGYEVNVNNGGWTPANGNLSHTVTGLSSGNVVFIQVRAIGGGPNCLPDVAAASAPFFVCNIEATLNSIQPTLCNGTATGSAVISVVNFTAPLQFFVNGQPPAYPNGNLLNIFPAGNNFVIVVDSVFCRDTVFFNIPEPPPIAITTSVTNAVCNGDPDGSASASANGGTGNITFAWQGCLGGPVMNGAMISSLYAGCYAVTATDANGCTAVDSVLVGEPDEFDFNSSQTPVSCFGGSDGTAAIEVTGGTPPYQYVWDNGDTGSFADSLDAGFHFVTITDGAGCQVATLALIIQPTLLVVDSITSKDATCVNGNNGTATVFAGGGTAPYAYLWNDAQGQTTQKAVNLPPGTYSVTVTDAKNCTVQANVTVGSPPDLTLSFTNVVNEQCAGECGGTATVQASGGTGPYDYFWEDPNLPDGSPTVGNLCPGSYLVTVVDFNGCTKTDKVTIEPAIPIDLHFDVIPPACAGAQDGSIFVTIGGGQPPYQVLWSNGATGPNNSNLPCGAHFVTVSDNVGCVVTSTILLNCPDSLKITSVVVQAVKCFGGSDGQIAVQAQGGTGTLSFLWNDPNAQSTPTASNLPAGNYTVTVTDGNGCTVTTTAQVTQPELLTVGIAKTDVTCFDGTDGTATATASGGTPDYQYFWNWTQNGQTISGLPAGNYLVTVVDANNCSATASADVAQPPTPLQVFASQTHVACFGENNGEAFASATGGNGEPFTYQWSNGQTGQTATGLVGGNLTVTATDSKGCTVTQSIEIQQLEKITVGVAFVPPTCFGGANGQAAINLVTGGAGMGDTTMYDYQWSVPNSPNSIYIGGLAGNKTYSVTATDAEGCTGSYSFFVTEPLQIIAQKTVENVSCFGFSDGSIEVTGIENANLPVTYAWSTGDVGVKIDSLAAGTYFLDILDAKGCAESDTVVISEPDLLEVAFDVQPLVCSNDQNAAIAANITGGTPEYTLLWNTGATIAEISGLGPGVYSLEIVDQNGCELADSVLITRPDSLEITSEKTDPQCFGGKDGRIRLLVTGGQTPFRYSVNESPFGGSSSFIGLGAGVYHFQIKDGNGCIATFTDSLGQPPQVSVSLGLDTTITLGDSLLISADVSNTVGIVEYGWRSFLLENFICVDTPECSMIQVKPYQTNTYVVEVTDENGCRGEGRVTVTVEKPRGVYVPTGFSPNGDLNNDLLIVHGKSRQIQKVVTFNIYDRWGELIYQDQNFLPNDDTRGWDGSFRGKACDPGVYVWYVEVEYLDGFREAMKGDVTLIR